MLFTYPAAYTESKNEGLKEAKFTLGIDWECYNQIAVRVFHGVEIIPSDDIERQTHRLLELLDNNNQKATFFVLGMLAKYRKDLVKLISDSGHEIGLHGQTHTHFSKLSREQITDEIIESRKIVSDVISKDIYGFRAPYFSVNEDNLFVLEILSELGFVYDSSIFPMKMKRYGISGFDPEGKLYQLPNGKEIVELPLAVGKLGNSLIPIGGGGYLRMLPKGILNYAIDKIAKSGQDLNMYFHPYEADPKKLDFSIPYKTNSELKTSNKRILKKNFQINLFRESCYGKMDTILKKHKFATCYERASNIKKRNSATILGLQK